MRAAGVDKFTTAQMKALGGERTQLHVYMGEFTMAAHDDATLAYVQGRGATWNACVSHHKFRYIAA